MSVRTLLLSTAVLVATTAPAFADSGTIFLNYEQGREPHPTPSLLSRAEVVNELEQAQQASGIQYYQVGEGPGYPPPSAVPRSGSELSRAEVVNELGQAQRASGIQYYQAGEGSGYPPPSAVPGSGKAMTHRGAGMPGGQGMMPDHRHQGQRR